MTLLALLRDPLARSVALADAVPLSVALEQMSKPSSKAATCIHCREPFDNEDVRVVIHAYCKAPHRRQREREWYASERVPA